MGISDILPDTKKEVALTLAGYTVAGFVTLAFLDYGTLALGIKAAATLPAEVTGFAVLTASTFVGYIIGKKDKV